MTNVEAVMVGGFTKYAFDATWLDPTAPSEQQQQHVNARANEQAQGAMAAGRIPGGIAGMGLALAAGRAAHANPTTRIGKATQMAFNPLAGAARIAANKGWARTGKGLRVAGKWGPWVAAGLGLAGLGAGMAGAGNTSNALGTAANATMNVTAPTEQLGFGVVDKIKEFGANKALEHAAPGIVDGLTRNTNFMQSMNRYGMAGGAGVGGLLGWLLGSLIGHGGAGAVLGAGIGGFGGLQASRNSDWSKYLPA